MKFLLSFLACLAAVAVSFAETPSPAIKADSSNRAGTLIIAGGGPISHILKHFVELAGGDQARIVVIPTASSIADRPDVQSAFTTFKMLNVPIHILHTRDRKQANDPKFVEPLRGATGVWIAGGDQSLLIASYKDTLLEKELHRFLASGKVVGGTSAGAAVMSPVMILGGNPVAQIGAGFGFIERVVVDQHFQNRKRLDRLLGVLGKHPDHIGIGIDERTAIVVKGTTVQVVGDANVCICGHCDNPREKVRVLAAGDQFDLPSMVRMFASDSAD